MPWTMPLTWKSMIKMMLTYDSHCFAFFGLSNTNWQFWHLVSVSYSIIDVSLAMMTLWSKSVSIWRCSMMSWHTSIHCFCWSAVLALILHRFPASLNFLWFLLNTVLFHVQLTYNHSHSQLKIVTYRLSYLLNTDLCSACWRPSTSLRPLNLLRHTKTPMHNGYISVLLLKYLKCLWWSFPKPNLKFLLVPRCS